MKTFTDATGRPDRLLLGTHGFFRSRGRTNRARAVEAQKALIDKAVTAIETRIDGIDLEAAIHGAMSGDSPDISDSIPDP